jgi:DNA-binding LytR/AlgR family response regulator
VDLSLSGTICMTLDGAVKAYVARRYVKKIKEVLKMGRRNGNEER